LAHLIQMMASYEDVRFQLRKYNDIVCVNTVCKSCQVDSWIGLDIIIHLDVIGLLLHQPTIKTPPQRIFERLIFS
jgi:hypothetical protein